ncbi:hypothetical protein Pfo_013656 [Paulownia fortunei]|nr:hypothetical protein Pfo_013656 [Paulownia fortunei]
MSNFLCRGMRGQKKMIFYRVMKPPLQNTSMRGQKNMVFCSNFEIATIMVVQTTSLEEQIVNLMKADVELTKHIQEQDSQITKLMNKVDNVDTKIEMFMKQHPNDREKFSKQLQVSSNGLIHVDQLKEFITETINEKFDGRSKSSLTYAKPYTKRIDNLKMTVGYQPLKFQQFNGKGNSKQHQYVHSLIENAFDWYTNLEANSIDSWEQLEQEFLNRFYSTRYIVKTFVIEIYIQRMYWSLCYIFQGIKPKTFGELATQAHTIEISMNFDKQECPSDVNDDEK